MDIKDILPGEDWKSMMLKAIRDATFFIACLSKKSINKRGMVQEEIKEALEVWKQKLENDIYLIPVRLENCEVPDSLRRFQWVDMFDKNWDAANDLMSALRIGLERLGITHSTEFLSGKEVKKLILKNNYYERGINPKGKGIKHDYELIVRERHSLVLDHATGKMWTARPHEPMLYSEVQSYIIKLNYDSFAGCNDWRMPTIEEAMSLVEPEENSFGMFINPIFDKSIFRIQTATRTSGILVWLVYFFFGGYGRESDDNRFPFITVRDHS